MSNLWEGRADVGGAIRILIQRFPNTPGWMWLQTEPIAFVQRRQSTSTQIVWECESVWT